jgi:hypothetical protein
MRDYRTILTAWVLCAALAGCGAGELAPPQAATDESLWDLTLNHHGVLLATVAPYDTVTLIATPRNAAGEPLQGISAPIVFTTSDTSVHVDPSGLVTARNAATKVRVVATIIVNNVRRQDSAYINITAGTPTQHIASISIQPAPGDSTTIAAMDGFSALFGGGKIISAKVLDGSNVAIPNVSVNYRSSDSTLASIDRLTGKMRPWLPTKRVKIYASTTVYGTSMTDSVEYYIGYPLVGQVDIKSRIPLGSTTPVPFFSPIPIEIGAGGVVEFVNASGISLGDLVFDDSVKVGSQPCTITICLLLGSMVAPGNIHDFTAFDNTGANMLMFRSFPIPGTYRYYNPQSGVEGTIVVKGND